MKKKALGLILQIFPLMALKESEEIAENPAQYSYKNVDELKDILLTENTEI